MQLAEAFEPKQQAAKFIFPAKHPLYGIESLFENGRVEEWLVASFGASSTAGVRVDIGNHPAIENGFAVPPAIVDAIQANDSSLKIKANARPRRDTSGKASRKSGDSLRLPGAETNGAITLQLRSQKATILSPFTFLCPLKPMSPRRTIATDDRGIEEIGFMKLQHRACKHGVKTAICLPLSKCAINARVVNFWMAFLIFFDRQLLPLAPQVKQS